MARYEKIEIDGELVPIQFGMRVVLEFCRFREIKFDDFTANMQEHLTDPDKLETLIYLGLVRGHKLAEKDLTIDRSTLLDCDAETYIGYMTMISDSLVATGNPEGGAKSGNGKKLKKVIKA